MLSINASSGTAPYEQLRLHIIAEVRAGRLSPGAKLPTVRSLAAQLGVAANTVARSYRELERAGVVETHGRNGTVVATNGDATDRAAQSAALLFVASIRQLEVSDAVALALVVAALAGQPPLHLAREATAP